MKCLKFLAALLVIASLATAPWKPAYAAINPNTLGASYNSQKTQITFRVYSANATYMVLYLYNTGYGAPFWRTEGQCAFA